MGRREAVVYGRRACLSVAEARADDLRRVFYEEGAPNRDLAPLLKACAQRRKPYRAVSDEELFKISGSHHHEGVVAVVTPLHSPLFEDYLAKTFSSSVSQPKLKSGRLPIWIALDRVENDHNHGAIARSLAWFGAEGLLWEGRRAQLSGAALRIAQGGADQISLLTVRSLSDSIDQLKSRGVLILGADQYAERSAFTRPPELEGRRGVCWVMGSEQFGLSKLVKQRCDTLVSIPGSGQIESLNVSVSAGLLMAQSHIWLQA